MTTTLTPAADRAAAKAAIQRGLSVRNVILSDLNRVGHAKLDDFDAGEFEKALNPLCLAVAEGRITSDSPEVWQVRFAIRNSAFRPTYEDVSVLVAKALGQRTSAPPENAEAYRVVTAPKALPVGPSTARNRARKVIEFLKAGESSRADALASAGVGIVRASTVADALIWTPAEGQSDPASVIPSNDQAYWIERAFSDLLRRYKGRHPLAVRFHAVKLWRQSDDARVPETFEGKEAANADG